MLLEQFWENDYYSAQSLRRARGFAAIEMGFWHRVKVAAEAARISPEVEMDLGEVERTLEEQHGLALSAPRYA